MEGTTEMDNGTRISVGNRGDMVTLTVSPPKDPTGVALRRAGIFVGAMAHRGYEVILEPDRLPGPKSD
jgi:hypothetical protein